MDLTLNNSKIKAISSTIIWLLSIFFFIIAIVIFLIQLSYIISPRSDFSTYYHGSQNLILGKSIYPGLIVQTPLSAILFIPFALLPYETAAIAWGLLLGIFYIVILLILLKELHFPFSRGWKFLFISLALCWHPFLSNISLGQISILLSLMLIGSWALLRREQEYAAGILLGLATLIKLFPGIFIFFLILRGYKKALLTMVATTFLGIILTILIVGWQDVSYYFFHVLFNSPKEFILIPINTSISGMISRFFIDGYWIRPILIAPQAAMILSLVISLSLVIFLSYRLLKINRSTGGFDVSYSLVILAMLLLSPITWAHNFPILILPIALLLFDKMIKSDRQRRIAVFIALILLSLPDLNIAISLMQLYAPNPLPWYAGLPFLAPTLGMAILVWQLLRRAHTGRLSERADKSPVS